MPQDPTPAAPVRVELSQAAGAAVLTLAGTLDVSTAAAARREVVGRLAGPRPAALEVALGEIMGEFLTDLKAVLPPRP